MDRGAWHAAVHGITESQTQVSNRTELNPTDDGTNPHVPDTSQIPHLLI